ncbi:MAG: hypothetical protein KAS30_00145, partial [Candidatus Diapherotrites archaeon]|nr:hypothetical protein [Candidatus Diapherotrites archaeon]
MAYKEGNSISDLEVLTNPYANQSNALQVIGINKLGDCQPTYYASVSYVVAAGGATTTITPLTGNDSAALNYYRVEVYDGENTATAQLDLLNPTNPFVVDTSSLDASANWTLLFYGSEGGDVNIASCELDYKVDLGAIGVAGGSGNTIPAKWKNVEILLLLTSTSDANFSKFPSGGVAIAANETVDLTKYLATGTQLVNGGSYIFTIQMKKRGTSPVAAAPTLPTNAVFASVANTVVFPYAVLKTYAEVNNTVTIATGVAGQH